MKIFYSWRSWTERNENQAFIQKALEASIQRLHTDESFGIEVALDRDTLGTAGSVAIADTIFRKISECNIFICDVTPVTMLDIRGVKNAVPNPNVLIELGYASAQLGWERIICILNTEYGEREILPFDLRHRRILGYRYKIGTDEKNAKGNLVATLADAIRGIVSQFPNHSSSVPIDVITKVKQLLPDVQRQIEFDEFIRQETNGFFEKVNSPEFFRELEAIETEHKGNIREIWRNGLKLYFQTSSQNLELMFCVVWYGDRRQGKYLGTGLTRWVETHPNNPQPKHIFNYIPSLLLAYVGGIAAVYKEKWEILFDMLLGAKITMKSGPFPTKSESITQVIIRELISRYQENQRPMNSTAGKPIGSNIEDLSKEILIQYFVSENELFAAFDIFEFIFMLVHLDYNMRLDPYHKPIVLRVSFDEYSNRSIEKIFEFLEAGGRQGSDWELLKAGFFDRDPLKLTEILSVCQEKLAKKDRYRDFAYGIPDYLSAYQRGLDKAPR